MCAIQFRAGWAALRAAGVHGFRAISPGWSTSFRSAVWRAGHPPSARAGRADDAPALLRHGALCGRRRHPGHDQLQPDPDQRASGRRSASTSGLDTLHISLDGATAETFERIRHGAHFDRVMRNIELVRAAKAAGGGTASARAAPPAHGDGHHAPEPARAARPGAPGRRFGDGGRSSCSTSATTSARRACPRTTLHARLRGRADAAERGSGARRAASSARPAQTAEAAGVNLRLPRTAASRSTRPARRAASAATGPGPAATSATAATPCPAAWSPRPTGPTWATWPSRALPPIWDGAEYEAFRARLASDNPPDVCRSCSLYHGTF